jgi:hypothetical protein
MRIYKLELTADEMKLVWGMFNIVIASDEKEIFDMTGIPQNNVERVVGGFYQKLQDTKYTIKAEARND